MKPLGWCGILSLLFGHIALAQIANLKQEYVGKTSCSPGLEKGPGSYGIRLDKKQVARLEARTVKGKKALMIVQYQKEWDDCGVVMDIIEAAHDDTDFIFECMDDHDPGAVVVGAWRTPRISGRSLESWRISLNGLSFVRIHRSLRYVPQTLRGDDDGSDLVDWARKRVSGTKVQVGH